MSNHRSRVLAARWIIPISSPPIHGGWVRMVDGRITDVGRGKPPADAENWGDVAILPRLVNAHTHLEFSGFDRPVGQHGISLAEWIGLVVASRTATDATDKQQAIDRGLSELWDTGSLLAGEITTPPWVYPQGSAIPKLVTFAEVLGLSKRRAAERLGAATDHVLSTRQGALSPHAPYSVSRDAIEATISVSQKHERMVAMHVAESPEERELLCNGSGPLAQSLIALGVWQQELFPWGADPYCQLIERLAAAKSVLLVHGNDLNEKEIQSLGTHDNLTVVYCPRTHHYFGFGRHPIALMLAAGVRLALGTDSRASNPDLNLWREVQFLLKHRTDLDPAGVLRMATKNGADALGYRRLGAIAPHWHGDLGCVETEAANLDALYGDLSIHDYRPIDSVV